jgi:hypothetical protein
VDGFKLLESDNTQSKNADVPYRTVWSGRISTRRTRKTRPTNRPPWRRHRDNRIWQERLKRVRNNRICRRSSTQTPWMGSNCQNQSTINRKMRMCLTAPPGPVEFRLDGLEKLDRRTDHHGDGTAIIAFGKKD